MNKKQVIIVLLIIAIVLAVVTIAINLTFKVDSNINETTGLPETANAGNIQIVVNPQGASGE